MEDILNIQQPVVFNESISQYEIHSHLPYTESNFNNNDEIQISIQHQDLNVLPCKSSIHICGRLTQADGTTLCTRTRLVNMAMAHLFDEIKYEINAVEVDRCKNVGITTLMKGWASYSNTQSLENAGWVDLAEETTDLVNAQGYFDFLIPLSVFLGFAEDYRKIVVNVKHELILRRSNSDLNAVVQTSALNQEGVPTGVYETFKINITRIEWLMPYVILSSEHKIRLLEHLQKDKNIAMSFRSRELFEYPMLQRTDKHVWTVKTANQLEKPRTVILAFQTERKNSSPANASRFDHRQISNVRLFLNSLCYPYSNLNLNINQNIFAILYEMYLQYQVIHNGIKDPVPRLTRAEFLQHVPLFVIDCSKQNETLKNAPVDVRLEIEARENFPANTSAYCLIIHDRIIEYNPMKGDVRRVV